MVQSNKVLTVSYGTFSCTLEGFEDSFDTMKAIAEYFRDLAADDRYFGAEPPQPDADMLARIAEREIARQVEARRDGSGFYLRAAEAGPAPMPPARPMPPTEDDIVAEATLAEAEAQQDEQTTPQAAAAQPVDAPQASAQAAPATVETTTQPMLADLGEATLAEAVPNQDAVAAFMATAEPVEDIEEDEETELAELMADPVTESPAASPDSIAAKLQRIRAVVSRNEKAAPAAVHADDQHSDNDFLARAARDIAAALDEDHEEIAPEIETRIEEAAEGPASEQTPEVPLVLTDELPQPEEDAIREDDHDDTLFADLDRDAPQAAADADETADDDLSEEGDRPHARVLKIKRAELEAALAAGDLEEVEDDEDADIELEVEDDEDSSADDHIAVTLTHPQRPAHPLPPGTLSPEDEADLMRELAEVEAELRGDDIEEEETGTAIAADHLVTADAQAAAATEDSQSDLSRLMAAADARLDDPETASTRETYSHLRAAVAATEAENSASGLAPKHPDADAYRDDLARVVHPRRPAASAPQGRRGGEPRPAPLKLVAEQRVDDMAPAPARPGPVRPRRVAAAHEAPRPTEVPSGSFAQFAHEMGATELPALLEAAAAYMQFVEGREQFTRPQLIHKAREASVEEFNREDGLRSFGVLLREGKIVKKDPGRFVASGEIGFQPTSSTRAAG
ncbi:hypothetical protein [Pseudodonghicola xiamenensis]|uniref:Lipoprotein n=1 Tax=Pseudodonghicola xiamenensis TaxID=337702 RepID=A0A8J3H5V7_9RHOB|nr:hypothetical protein [Pseudodonghicola xiamenensis]GHG90604.1 hypothetical protein GCM10010961_21320 [Pseudodonghicola xiamenensis]